MKRYEFWFVTGSQHLYGAETLEKAEENSRRIAGALEEGCVCRVIPKALVKSADEASRLFRDADSDEKCAGVITWMHTFSPAKMWINGLAGFGKPLLHLHTQVNTEIPAEEIDMDYMNLHQSAHGDREFGFLGARLRLPRKIVVGHFTEHRVQEEISGWMRSAVGVYEGKRLRCLRFGDNMREVAVTEGDKVEAQIKFGWSVNTRGVGDLAETVGRISEGDALARLSEYRKEYEISQNEDTGSILYQAKLELALLRLFGTDKAGAFTTTFEDLHGLEQLPGLASQQLMSGGFGFAAEGDWKTACLLRVMKCMSRGLESGTTFMEDYTYHFGKRESLVLGAHMLEICPSVRAGKGVVSVEPLGIGGKNPPARIKFEGRAGEAVCVSLVDMGDRFRMIAADVLAVKPVSPMPKLPVAQIMWKPLPDLETSAKAWLTAGGAHHTVLSFDLTAQHMEDYADMLGIEFVHIGKDTDLSRLKSDLLFGDLVWRLRGK